MGSTVRVREFGTYQQMDHALGQGDVDIAILEFSPWEDQIGDGYCHVSVSAELEEAVRDISEFEFLPNVDDSEYPVFVVTGMMADELIQFLGEHFTVVEV